MMELIKDTKIDFIGLRKYAFIISAIFVVIGVFSFVMISIGKANLSIDFTGGTNVQVRFSDKVNIGDLRHALETGGINDVQIQEVSGTRDFFIKTKVSDTEKESVSNKMLSSRSSWHCSGSSSILPGGSRLYQA
jgi:preprotein translocase subunit SecF